MAKVKDPVCGMLIEDNTALAHGDYQGQTVYFCSSACQKSYERAHSSSA